MQLAIVIVIILIAIAYATWRTSHSFQEAADPCCGCNDCPLKDRKKQKEYCAKKKHEEKFGRMKKKH
jgi:hypothetical protein